MIRRALLTIFSVTVLTGLTGCSTDNSASTHLLATADSTIPSNSGSVVSTTTGPEFDLHKVGACQLLKADQLAARDVVKPGEIRENKIVDVGETCQWRPQDRILGTSFSATILDKGIGVESYYARKAECAEFQEIEIAGYRAFNGTFTDFKSGSCTTGVGVAKGQAFLVQVYVNEEKLPEYTNPCSVTGDIAKTIVENLKN